MRHRTPTILILGPLPPPFGGIATIVSLLTNASFESIRIELLETTIPGSGSIARISHGLRVFGKLVTAILRSRPAGLMCFCGAYASFWEKGLWGLTAKLLNVPAAVVMVDGNFPGFEKSLGRAGRCLMRVVLRVWTRICVQSKGWQTYYESITPHDRFSIIVGGVNHAALAPEDERRIKPKDTVTILYVGWLIEDKGIYELLEAAALLKSKNLRFQIRLVGPLFDQEVRLRRALSDLDLTDDVIVVGPVRGSAEFISEYRSADIFVIPSRAEGFSYVVLEAMAAGVPVVATQVGGLPEIVEPGINGILVEPRNVQQLAAALDELVTSSATRERMGEAARMTIVNKFTLAHSLASYERVFHQLAEAGARPA